MELKDIKTSKMHEIKIYPSYYRAIYSGEKTFELRKNDRDYEVGDILRLQEWTGTEYTGRSMMRRITYIYKGTGKYGLEDGYCILGIKKVR